MPTGETSGLPIAPNPNDRTLINAGDAPTIAVLPFENLSHDSRWSYFCDGLVEDIITDLAYHRDIRIIARQSSFKYRGQPHDVREIGLALGAVYVLEGSLQTDSGRLKVTSQLIDARTGSHLWARRYTREEAGLFEIQEAIVGDVVAALTGFEGSILRAELARARRKHPANLRAYELYLLGYEQEARADRQGTLRAIELMELAVQADPQFSRAWAVLGWALGNAAEEGWVHDLASASGRQRHAIVEAAALDPRDGLALSELVGLQLKDGNFPAARQTVELALAAGANHADTLALTAKYVSTFLGRPDEALSLMQRAFALNPHAPSWYALGEVYVCYYSRRFEAAIEAAPRATAGRSQTFCSVISLAQLGRDAEMAAARSELYALDPELQIAKRLRHSSYRSRGQRIIARRHAEGRLTWQRRGLAALSSGGRRRWTRKKGTTPSDGRRRDTQLALVLPASYQATLPNGLLEHERHAAQCSGYAPHSRTQRFQKLNAITKHSVFNTRRLN
jgi:adenylate cyclase